MQIQVFVRIVGEVIHCKVINNRRHILVRTYNQLILDRLAGQIVLIDTQLMGNKYLYFMIKLKINFYGIIIHVSLVM